jgi:hypothetical protein
LQLFREVCKSSRALRQLVIRATALRILIPAMSSPASAMEVAKHGSERLSGDEGLEEKYTKLFTTIMDLRGSLSAYRKS